MPHRRRQHIFQAAKRRFDQLAGKNKKEVIRREQQSSDR